MENLWILFIVALADFTRSAPVAKRMIDLTHDFDNETLHHPLARKFEINMYNVTVDENIRFRNEEYSSGAHAGTHMDAPCHFTKGKWTIEQIPLERFIAPAAVVDIKHKVEENNDYLLTVDDLEKWENKTGQLLNHVILLVRSGWDIRWGNDELYKGTAGSDGTQLHHPGISPEAAQWLVDNRNVYGVGVDTFSLDHGPSPDYPSHRIILGANIYGLENVANLGKLPFYGAKLHVMPMKIGSASGAPTRIVATYPSVVY